MEEENRYRHSELMKKLLVLPLGILISVSGASTSFASTIIWQENFQAQTPGGSPVGAVVEQSAGSKVVVVSDTTTIPDPFNIAGNQSLMLEKTAVGLDQIPRVIWELPSISTGVLSLDAYTTVNAGEGFGTPLLNFFWYDGTVTAANTGVRFWINAQGNITVGDGAATRVISGAWASNQVNHLEIELFADNTYSISINGDLLEWISGSTVKSKFAYQGSALLSSDLDHLQFSVASVTQVGSRFFVDNVALIPEPSTYALLSFATLFGVATRYQRGKVSV